MFHGRSIPNPDMITERTNGLTRDIDKGDALTIVNCMEKNEQELFSGHERYEALYSRRIVDGMDDLIEAASKLLEGVISGEENNLVLFTGCGTSGRMGWLCCREFNNMLERHGAPPCFDYCMAGGDEALMISKELPEDSPLLGVEDLKAKVKDKKQVFVVGISCGLSAPYVAGQLDWALKQENIVPIGLGFNPVHMSRYEYVEKWDKTCRQVYMDLDTASRAEREDGQDRTAYLINPVVGPEAIAGSTRMKGGSATKVILEMVFLEAIEIALKNQNSYHPGPKELCMAGDAVDTPQHRITSLPPILTHMTLYRLVYTAVYDKRSKEELAKVITLGSRGIDHPGGHLYYLGSDGFGLLGVIDASEMVDTYGAPHDEVRGFVEGGWSICRNTEGDLSGTGQAFRMSLEHFEEDILPNITDNDTVILLSGEKVSEGLLATWKKLTETQATLARVVVMSAPTRPTHEELDLGDGCPIALVNIPWASTSCFRTAFEEYALKCVVNLISTGGNIIKGRVLDNIMVNLSVSNNKLYMRAAYIVKRIAIVEDDIALFALNRSIYRDNMELLETSKKQPISDLVHAARGKKMVVPLAILLALHEFRGIEEYHLERAMKKLKSVADLRQIVSRVKDLRF